MQDEQCVPVSQPPDPKFVVAMCGFAMLPNNILSKEEKILCGHSLLISKESMAP